jgi:alginate O-acetyltransferase complex protein AlgI
LLDFALFVSFFPQLVAGPIVRASDFLPQLRTLRNPSWPRCYDGFRQFTIGLFKKMFIADNLAGFVDRVFSNAGAYDTLTTWLAVIAYAIQIYCDFSGYSDMAIGLARVLGYDLMENFHWPYLSTRIDEFWRRWHISLSTWLRDYLYIPLGGNRKGRTRTYINLMITMLLGGLWHGAAWTFVVWGAIHGLSLAVVKFVGEQQFDSNQRSATPWRQVTGWLATMFIVLVAWVFFRSPNFDVAARMLGAMLGIHRGFSYLPAMMAVLVPMAVGAHLVQAMGYHQFFWLPANRLRSATVLLTMIWLVVVFHPRNFSPFIYFQF